MTTTGGPDHSVAEPATSERMDGDDIVVIPDAPPDRHRRSRALIVGGVVAVLIAAGIGVAIAATRDDGKQQVHSAAPVRPAPTPTHPPNAVKKPPKTPAKTPATTPLRNVEPPVTAIAPPPPVVPATEPPVTSPPAEPTSVLQWSAVPSALTIKSGGRATLTVHVVNPTDGTVTLGHPLSCPPTLRGPSGNVIGFGVCTEIAQVMNPHDELTQQYTISANANGKPLKPGNYTASVENLFDVRVKITAS